MNTKRITVFVLSGFLGSGKTTLLTQAIDHFGEMGRKTAVIMNEIGEVNLDGQLVDASVPMAELLGGCICCSSRGDLAATLHELVLSEKPDMIFIESTGVANPMEILDEITDASLILPVELKAVITVVDAPQLLELSRTSRGKTYRLMQDQIRCANLLLLNKTDLLPPSELTEVDEVVREWNEHAKLEYTVFSRVDMRLLELFEEDNEAVLHAAHTHMTDKGHEHVCTSNCDHHDHDHEHMHSEGHVQAASGHHHHTHDHVMAYTHFFEHPVNSHSFEAFVSKLPQNVYRAKGVLTFSDTPSRFMFQYAYREMDFVKITPKAEVPNVAVFIGEQFSKDAVRSALLELEREEQSL
ncbi:CobW family GTP-binding protein [Paenibacillus hexagrammi]|uniref:GTP-binding protein n=1 Tax=Paenibacillus hexagrammi TaxID=2908839 RepID=A0ABY3SQ89_9BACL|nr:GTP-binding protein [Paenibacillus sp. YPD9-1]UJF35290.1 GTP-binding protein [Paenibacillus sp. YPD9-1]